MKTIQGRHNQKDNVNKGVSYAAKGIKRRWARHVGRLERNRCSHAATRYWTHELFKKTSQSSNEKDGQNEEKSREKNEDHGQLQVLVIY